MFHSVVSGNWYGCPLVREKILGDVFPSSPTPELMPMSTTCVSTAVARSKFFLCTPVLESNLCGSVAHNALAVDDRQCQSTEGKYLVLFHWSYIYMSSVLLPSVL